MNNELSQKFAHIYDKNVWHGTESKSGTGSTLETTQKAREALLFVVYKYDINTLLDIPCGDFHWMSHLYFDLSLDKYYGYDIVPSIIEKLQDLGGKYREFKVADITCDELPKVDLVFCRDCLVHLSEEDTRKAIENIKKSGSTYLMTTTFTNDRKFFDIVSGRWRPINLQKEPFNWKEPLELYNEDCHEGNDKFTDKSLGLWEIKNI